MLVDAFQALQTKMEVQPITITQDMHQQVIPGWSWINDVSKAVPCPTTPVGLHTISVSLVLIELSDRKIQIPKRKLSRNSEQYNSKLRSLLVERLKEEEEEEYS
jgi:hypothetical protein